MTVLSGCAILTCGKHLALEKPWKPLEIIEPQTPLKTRVVSETSQLCHPVAVNPSGTKLVLGREVPESQIPGLVGRQSGLGRQAHPRPG